MKQSDLLLIGGLALVAFLFVNNNSGDVANGTYDFTQLTNDPTDLAYLQNFYNALYSQGLTDLQCQLMFAQCLNETGLLTGGANYNNIQMNNWAGIKHGNSYVSYPDLQSFFNEYIKILSKGSNPLGATSTDDFNNRLIANGYYTDPNRAAYLSNLNKYFHLLYLASLPQTA